MGSEQQDADSFKIQKVPPRADVDIAGIRDTGITVLPVRRTDDGRGVYPQGAAEAVKALRVEGEDIDFLDESSNRVFEAKFGFMTDFAIPYAIGFASNGGWAGLASLAQRLRGKGPNNVIRITVEQPRSGKAWLLEGPAASAPAAIRQFEKEQQLKKEEGDRRGEGSEGEQASDGG